MKKIWVNGMMGVVVGDALGVPVQFASRIDLKINPVKKMEGYGRFYMPPGTWSDDSSLALATLDSIREMGEINYPDICERFVRWLFFGSYTPAGQTFDVGDTCKEAIRTYEREKDYRTCGKTGEQANGNGALMRIMPVCLFAYEKVLSKEWTVTQAIECIHQVGALTHNHLRSNIACGIYYFMVQNIIDGKESLSERLQKGIEDAEKFYRGDGADQEELDYYERLFRLDKFAKCKEDEIKSTGYVVASLEAAIWSLITTGTLEECLLKAVNLGGDTDTIGAIAGGLACLYYGYESVPEAWRKQIIKEDKILASCEIMEERF